MLVYVVLVASLIWLLAVFKVFILDDGKANLPLPVSRLTISKRSTSVQPRGASRHDSADVQTNGKAFKPRFTTTERLLDFKKSGKTVVPTKAVPYSSKKRIPNSADWLAMYTESKGLSFKADSAASGGQLNPALKTGVASTSSAGLSWPPVKPDGTFPDGYDIMPFTEFKVPKFWAPASGEDVFKLGKTVNDQETIFLMIASYRDFQCRETITSAFLRADHPERLFVAAVDQIVAGDTGCLDIDVPCSKDPEQPICKYRDQISVYVMDATKATGPVTARHVGDRMYRGQSFAMQLDAHCHFVRHWDTKIIDQWKSTQNEMAVLTSYLTDFKGSLTAKFDSTRNTRPIMCNSDFEGMMPARYLRHGSQPEDYPIIRDMPQLEPFWAAGFSFSRGHFKVIVPYDGYQPMVFQGEEIAIGIRGFTHGYDFYAPRDSVVFHEYADNSDRRKKIHMFWENKGHAGEGQKSLRRATSIIGMAPDIDPTSWDHSEIEKYGLGKVRDLALFYKIFLIDSVKRKAVQLCPFVNSGTMHRDFQPFLRPDGMGIDYSHLQSYDTYSKLDAFFSRQHPQVERDLRNALQNKNIKTLEDTIAAAEKVQLQRKNPDLIAQAQKRLKELRNAGVNIRLHR